MADIKQATVYIYLDEEPVPAGILRTHVEGRHTSSEFVYGNKYITRPNAISVDPFDLPLPAPGDIVKYNTREDFQIFNGIRDASPDDWGRYLLHKKFSVKGLDEFDYVAASGPDRVGALAFGKSADSGIGLWNTESFIPPPDPESYLDLAEIQKAIDSADDPYNPDFQKLVERRPSMGGARPKGTVYWEGSLYIAKFSLSSDSYDVCIAEYATMLLAKKSGIKTPKVSLATIDGKSIYLVERFDRILDGDKRIKRRLPFHSALTMSGTHEGDYSRHSYLDVLGAITRFSPDATRDRKELYKRMVFNVFCNNADDHMRNHGFLYSGDGQWELSPAYDIVPIPQSTQTYRLAMYIGEDGKDASINNAMSAAKHFGLKNTEAKQIIEVVREATKDWKDFFADCGAKAEDIDRLTSCFREL